MTIPDDTWMIAGEDDIAKTYEPTSLRELSPRDSRPPFSCSISDKRPLWALTGMLLPFCLMGLLLVGALVLLWLTWN